MRKSILAIIALSLVLSTGCVHNWGNFRKISTEVPANVEVVGTQPVEGQDCAWLFGYWYWRSMAQAVRNALALAPGATGLKDVEVTWSHKVIGTCLVVKGTPVKEAGAKAGK